MAKKASKPRNPFSTEKWKLFKEAPQSLRNLLENDGDYTPYRGRIDGEESFFFVGRFDEKLYAYSIKRENLSQVEKLKEKRLAGLNCRFIVNVDMNPFDGCWELESLDSKNKTKVPHYEVKPQQSQNSIYYVGGFWDKCYVLRGSAYRTGHEIDWVKVLGVYVPDYY